MEGTRICCQTCVTQFKRFHEFKQHLYSMKHQQRMKEDFETDVSHGAGFIPHIIVMDSLHRSDIQPILGLSLLTVCFSQGFPTVFYLCHVCEAKCSSNTIISHLSGSEHNVNYFNYTDPNKLRFSWIPCRDIRVPLTPAIRKDITGASRQLQMLNLPKDLLEKCDKRTYSEVMNSFSGKIYNILDAITPKRLLIEAYQKDNKRKHPLLGLQHLIECVSVGQTERRHYLCTLCNLTLAPGTPIRHVLSFDHIFNYFKAWHPSTLMSRESYKNYTHDFSSMMLDLARQTQNLHGSAHSKIRQVHLEPEVFASVNFSSYTEALRKLESIRRAKNESSLITPVNSGNKLVRCTPSTYKLQCQNCSMTFVSDSEYFSHVASMQHKMMVKQFFGGAENTSGNDPPASNPNLNVYRISKKQKAIGVCFVVMCFSSQLQEQPLYICIACKDSFHESSLKMHLDSKKHLVQTLLHQSPWQLPLCWRDKPNETDLRSKAREDEKKREPTSMKVLDIPHQRFSKLSPPSYETVVEELEPYFHILQRDVPLSHNATKPNERFPLLALNFLVMYAPHATPREQFLCLLCNRKLTDDESHTHSFSWEHVGKFMLYFHHGSLNSSTSSIEALQNLAKQATRIHEVSEMQVIRTKKPIPQIWPYKEVTTFLSCEKRKNGQGPLKPPIVARKKLEITRESPQEEESQEDQIGPQSTVMMVVSEKKADQMSTDKREESLPSEEEKLFSATNSNAETSSEAPRFNEGATKRSGIIKSPDSCSSDAGQCKKRRVSFEDDAIPAKKPTRLSGGKQVTTADGGQSLKLSPKTTNRVGDAPPHHTAQPLDPQPKRLVCGEEGTGELRQGTNAAFPLTVSCPKGEQTLQVSGKNTQSAMHAHAASHKKSQKIRLSDAEAVDHSSTLGTQPKACTVTDNQMNEVVGMEISDAASEGNSRIESDKIPANQDVRPALSKVPESAGKGREKPSGLRLKEKETSSPILHYNSRGLKSDHFLDSVPGPKLGPSTLKSKATHSKATATTSPTAANPQISAERATGKPRDPSSKGAVKSSAPATSFKETSPKFAKESAAASTNTTSGSKSAESSKSRETRSSDDSKAFKSTATKEMGSAVVCTATHRTLATSSDSHMASKYPSATSSAPASTHDAPVTDSSTGSLLTVPSTMPIQKPLPVGLNYVIKVTCGEKKQVYCLLCRVRMTDSSHTVTPSHYYNYVKATLPGLHLNRVDLSTLFKTVRQMHDIEKNSRNSLVVQREKVTEDVYKELKILPEQEAIQRLEGIMKQRNAQLSVSSPSSANDAPEALGQQVVIISSESDASSPDVIILDSSSEEETEVKVKTPDAAPTDRKSKSKLAPVVEVTPETFERLQPDPELKTAQKKVEENQRTSPLTVFGLDCSPSPSWNMKQKSSSSPGQKDTADSWAGPEQHSAPQMYPRITIGQMAEGSSHLSLWLKAKNIDGVIGLSSVWECRGIPRETFFLCESCRETLSRREICQHMVSSKHQSNYLLSQVPELSLFWSKEDLLPEVKEYILKRVAEQECSERKDAQTIRMVQELYEWVGTAPFSEALQKVQEIKRVKKLTDHRLPWDPVPQSKDQQHPQGQQNPTSPSGPAFQMPNETRPQMKKPKLDETGKLGDVDATRECAWGSSSVYSKADTAESLGSTKSTCLAPHETLTDDCIPPALLTSQAPMYHTWCEKDVKKEDLGDPSIGGPNTGQTSTLSYCPSKKRPFDKTLCLTDSQPHEPLPAQLAAIPVWTVPDSTTSDEDGGRASDKLGTLTGEFVHLKNLLSEVRGSKVKCETKQSQPAADSSEKTIVEQSLAKRWDSPFENTAPQIEKKRWDSRWQRVNAPGKRRLSHSSPEGDCAAEPADIAKDSPLQGDSAFDSLATESLFKGTEARATESVSPSTENSSQAGVIAPSQGQTPWPESKPGVDTSVGFQWPIQVIIGSNSGPAMQKSAGSRKVYPISAAALSTDTPPVPENYSQLSYTSCIKDGRSGYPFNEAAPNPTADNPPVLTGSQRENLVCGEVYPGPLYPGQQADHFAIVHFAKGPASPEGLLSTLQFLQQMQPQIYQSQQQHPLFMQQQQQVQQPQTFQHQLVQQQMLQAQPMGYQGPQQIPQPGIQQPHPIQLKHEQKQYCPGTSPALTTRDGTVYRATPSVSVLYPEAPNQIHSSFVQISQCSASNVSSTLSSDTVS